MFPIQKSGRWIMNKFNLNVNSIVFDMKYVSTVSSLFQPTCLPPKDATIKKDEPTSKSQKVSDFFEFFSFIFILLFQLVVL